MVRINSELKGNSSKPLVASSLREDAQTGKDRLLREVLLSRFSRGFRRTQNGLTAGKSADDWRWGLNSIHFDLQPFFNITADGEGSNGDFDELMRDRTNVI